MLEGQVNIKNSCCHGKLEEGLNHENFNNYIKDKTMRLIQQVAQLLSFVRALKIMIVQDQWTDAKREYLLDKIILIQQQLTIWTVEIQNYVDLIWIKKENRKVLNSYIKQTIIVTASAIIATNDINLKDLNTAINRIENKFQKLLGFLYENNHDE